MSKIKSLVVNEIVNMSSFFYKGVKYKTDDNIVKVNLGCGLQCLPGWINIDGSLTALLGSKRFPIINKILYRLAGSSNYYSFGDYNKVIQNDDLKFYDLKKGVPIYTDSANVIYCSHFLEHLSKDDGKTFLKECYRSLKNGGLLRIAVPDLDFAMNMYKSGDIEKMQDLFFYTSPKYDFAAHKYNYNYQYLKDILENIGFKDVKKMSYRCGDCPNIDFLDVYPDHSLYVECIK